MLVVENLQKRFDNFYALKGVDLNVKEGSIYGLVGPNGAGKTTLMKNVAGIYTPTGGSVKFRGEEIFENNEIKQKIQFIPDELYFQPRARIIDMAKYYAQIYPDFSFKRYESLKQIFEIDEKKYIRKLSKGMKKQVAFWMAISSMPDLMILDEPVDGLDPVARKRVWNAILQDVAERSTSLIISSHNLRELEDVCDHIGIMHDGLMLLEKEIDDLKSDIFKIQVAFKSDVVLDEIEGLKILSDKKLGSVHNLIIRGEREQIHQTLSGFNPLIMDVIPLTLEEIFIHEIGGVGYEPKEIIF